MKNLILLFVISLSCFSVTAQNKPVPGKYPGLLWEITGNGLKKPSYLFGTMHVSSKMAFNLPDSFYFGIKNADVVALETNPESWQEDMYKYAEQSGENYATARNDRDAYSGNSKEYFTISNLRFFGYDKKIEEALFSSPAIINNLLYRSYGMEDADFEEDTYLDMYIYQCGKRWSKKVTGVEDYEKSMLLMNEAYRDAAKDKTPPKELSYDYNSEYAPGKLQEAYRNGNLDQLDSINKLNSQSVAFDEKFLYKRNEIQAAGIDSIIKTGAILFVGVGAAHLPGNRGVIELLRQQGYKLRPVKTQTRDSRQKEDVEKLRVPVFFKPIVYEDGFIKIEVPGKLFKTNEDLAFDQRQYADMANGSFYMITRLMTNALIWNHSVDYTLRKIDSLLYENVPGKILSKTLITKNGFKGFDIINRTRRGDLQRYQILVTPFEIILFKMGGIGDYIKNGTEAQRFFNSIQLREYKNINEGIKYSPPHGGFSVMLPHIPFTGNDGNRVFDAADKNGEIHYRVIRSAIHNYNFTEEDDFDLALMEESFASSECIARQISRSRFTHLGYPALECRFKDKDSALFITRFIIQGPFYYTLMAHGKNESAGMRAFFNSFEIKPYEYGAVKERTDTSLHFTVRSPVFPEDKKIKPAVPQYSLFGQQTDDETDNDKSDAGVYRYRVIEHDTTGERIIVEYSKNSVYDYLKDSASFENDIKLLLAADSSWIIRMKKQSSGPGKMTALEYKLTSGSSSRMIWGKKYYGGGVNYSILTETDTLTKPSLFLKDFFETFLPTYTISTINLYEKKTPLFFSDYFSSDSLKVKRAFLNLSMIEFDTADLPQMKKAIAVMNWEQPRYLFRKKILIEQLSDIKTRQSSDYLNQLYHAAGDTVELQYAVLEALLVQQTDYSFKLFSEIVSHEPPVLNVETDDLSFVEYADDTERHSSGTHFFNGDFIEELCDSLQLTKKILPDLLPLMNIDEYEKPVMELLGKLVDSNLIQQGDYEMYYNKFLLEAKQELKKQAIAEKKMQILKKAESKNEGVSRFEDEALSAAGTGNDKLELYTKLLLPFYDQHPEAGLFISQLFNSGDKKLKYDILLLLLKYKKQYPDTLLHFFAVQDDYRYQLYCDLKAINRKELFPEKFNTHIELGRSRLIIENAINRPDSVMYLDRLPAEYKGKNGFVYFFKVKPEKDDAFWNIATAGLVPEQPEKFEFDEEVESGRGEKKSPAWPLPQIRVEGNLSEYDFTAITDTKIVADKPLADQLHALLKKMYYSKRKSGKYFYSDEDFDGNRSSNSLFGYR